MSWWSSVLVKEWEGMGLWRETLGEDGLSSGRENYLGVARADARAALLSLRDRAARVMKEKRVSTLSGGDR